VASVTKRRLSNDDVRYDVRYRTPSNAVRTKTFRTSRDAARFASTVEVDKFQGGFVDPRLARVKLTEYATTWLAERPNLRERTRYTYGIQLRLHILARIDDIDLGATELGRLSPSLVRAWHSRLSTKLRPNSAAKCYRLLRTILGTAVADGLIAQNPCKIAGAGVERTAERPVATVAQMWELAREVPDRYRCLILVAGFVGLRRGELLGLERRHVDLLHRTLRIEQQQTELADGRLLLGPPKTTAGIRSIALPEFLVPELEAHLARFAGPGIDGRVFTGPRGGPVRNKAVRETWCQARDRVDLPQGFRFHDLRHTANTLAATTGASTRELMHRLGHASSVAALRYQHLTQERDIEVARLLDELVQGTPSTRRQTGA